MSTDAWRHRVIYHEIRAAREAVRGHRKLAAAATQPPPSAPREFIHVPIDLSTAALHTLVQGVAGRRIAVYEVFLWSAGAQDLEFFDGGNTLTGPISGFPAQQGIYLPNTGDPHWLLTVGESLKLNLGQAQQVSGYVLYRMQETE